MPLACRVYKIIYLIILSLVAVEFRQAVGMGRTWWELLLQLFRRQEEEEVIVVDRLLRLCAQEMQEVVVQAEIYPQASYRPCGIFVQLHGVE